jgi:NAD(P)-dependent dehydrogenase (short-subunit alcohol dehydrogenase family)
MSKILITGCSSGFGLDTAKLFLDRGWDVVATMRTLNAAVLPQSDRLRILPLDITDADSVAKAVTNAGPIDVLVNNAGFGVPSPIELTEPKTARALFETNTLGTLAMVQAVLPALPLVGLYRASKAAVNAFTESLAVEVKPFGVRVHLVLPGRAPETKFGENAFPHLRGRDNPDYAPMIDHVLAGIRDASGPMTHSSDVAEAIWRVANDPSAPLRTAAGADAEAWLAEAKIAP